MRWRWRWSCAWYRVVSYRRGWDSDRDRDRDRDSWDGGCGGVAQRDRRDWTERMITASPVSGGWRMAGAGAAAEGGGQEQVKAAGGGDQAGHDRTGQGRAGHETWITPAKGGRRRRWWQVLCGTRATGRWMRSSGPSLPSLSALSPASTGGTAGRGQWETVGVGHGRGAYRRSRGSHLRAIAACPARPRRYRHAQTACSAPIDGHGPATARRCRDAHDGRGAVIGTRDAMKRAPAR